MRCIPLLNDSITSPSSSIFSSFPAISAVQSSRDPGRAARNGPPSPVFQGFFLPVAVVPKIPVYPVCGVIAQAAAARAHHGCRRRAREPTSRRPRKDPLQTGSPMSSRLLGRLFSGMATDFRTVDALARLRLAGKRLGFEVRLTPAEELVELLELAGLVEVLWKPEEGEEPLGVEEDQQLGDAPA